MRSSDTLSPTDFSRRTFLGTALAGALAAPRLSAGAEVAATGTFAEPGRNLPLVSDANVIVCGAGPAGVAAAITAARTGAKVRLFEWRGCIGGVWTAGLLGYLLDCEWFTMAWSSVV